MATENGLYNTTSTIHNSYRIKQMTAKFSQGKQCTYDVYTEARSSTIVVVEKQ
jgi:hypothetical protein